MLLSLCWIGKRVVENRYNPLLLPAKKECISFSFFAIPNSVYQLFTSNNDIYQYFQILYTQLSHIFLYCYFRLLILLIIIIYNNILNIESVEVAMYWFNNRKEIDR